MHLSTFRIPTRNRDKHLISSLPTFQESTKIYGNFINISNQKLAPILDDGLTVLLKHCKNLRRLDLCFLQVISPADLPDLLYNLGMKTFSQQTAGLINVALGCEGNLDQHFCTRDYDTYIEESWEAGKGKLLKVKPEAEPVTFKFTVESYYLVN